MRHHSGFQIGLLYIFFVIFVWSCVFFFLCVFFIVEPKNLGDGGGMCLITIFSLRSKV